MHNKALSVVANARLQSRLFDRGDLRLRHSPTPSGLAEIVGDNLPILDPVSITPVGVNCRFKFEKGSQVLLSTYNKASCIAALWIFRRRAVYLAAMLRSKFGVQR